MMRNWFDARAQHLGLTRAQWRVLIQLSAREGASQRETGRDPGNRPPSRWAAHIDRLERDNWLERRPDPDDRRVWRLHLTPAAVQRWTRLEALAIQLQEDAVAGLSEAERSGFERSPDPHQGNVIAASAAEISDELDAG